MKGGSAHACGVLAVSQRDAWSLLIVSGDHRPGGRDAHWRLPAKPGPSLTPHPCRSQSHLLQEASPEPRRRALPTRAGVPGALATAYTDPGITSLAPLASVQARRCVAG